MAGGQAGWMGGVLVLWQLAVCCIFLVRGEGEAVVLIILFIALCFLLLWYISG
jgi:hypothetical protein